MTEPILEEFPTFPSRSPLDFDLAELAQVRENLDRVAQKQRVAQRDSRRKAGLLSADAHVVHQSGTITNAAAETLALYAHRGLRLFNDYRREANIPSGNEEYCALAFSEWVLGKRPLWADGTWRSVRASVSYYLTKIPDNDVEEAIALIEATGQPLLRESTRDQNVVSFLPHKQFEDIRGHVKLDTRNDDAIWLSDFMLAGVATGLGADEWKLTKLSQGTDSSGQEYAHLYVFDLRCASLGAPGSYRILDISALSADVRVAVRRISDQGRHWASTGKYASRKHAISTLLSTTFAALFPRKTLRCTLDSIQFQAIANFQATYKHEEISALLGDAFIDLPVPNYAHRDKSWAKSCIPGHPKPDAKAISRFRRILKIYNDRRTLQELCER